MASAGSGGVVTEATAAFGMEGQRAALCRPRGWADSTEHCDPQRSAAEGCDCTGTLGKKLRGFPFPSKQDVPLETLAGVEACCCLRAWSQCPVGTVKHGGGGGCCQLVGLSSPSLPKGTSLHLHGSLTLL